MLLLILMSPDTCFSWSWMFQWLKKQITVPVGIFFSFPKEKRSTLYKYTTIITPLKTKFTTLLSKQYCCKILHIYSEIMYNITYKNNRDLKAI